MIYGQVWRAIVRVGLDPYFGLIHESQRGRGSLVFDLIEEFRAPFGDRLLFGMLGRRFHPEIEDGGFLKMRCRRQLASAFVKCWTKKTGWRSQLKSPEQILEHQAENLVKLICRERDYQPFKMKW
jgi:CRISPR-associated protein Cas1